MNKKSNIMYLFFFHRISIDINHDWFHFLPIEIDEDKLSQHFFNQKFFTPSKSFLPQYYQHTHTLSLFYFYIISFTSKLYLLVRTSFKYRMFVKVFYPFLIFWKVFYPTYESKMIWKFDESNREWLYWERW